MPAAKPFFSIVIPTRRRTQVVAWAIQSALAQTFTDLECVVIDNNLDDRLDAIFAQFNDPRLRRVKTGNLNMPDNLEQAYLNAQGTYVLLIEDRQCLYHHVLSYIHKLAQKEDLDCLVWNNDVFEDAVQPARLRRHDGDRSVKRVVTDEVLEGVSHPKPGQDPMRFIAAHRCAVRVSLLAQIRARTGLNICEPVSPDYTAGIKIMNELESYHYFNGAFSVSHSDQLSNGANFHRQKSSVEEFWKSIGGKKQAYAYAPIKACFNENTAMNDYMRLAEVLGGRLQAHPVDLAYYYTRMGSALLQAQEAGHDRTEELKAWRKALEAESPELRRKVNARLAKQSKRRLLQNLRVRLGIRAVERMLRKKKAPVQKYEEVNLTLPDFMVTESLVLAKRDLAPIQPATLKA
jgi:hypothetical protein